MRRVIPRRGNSTIGSSTAAGRRSSWPSAPPIANATKPGWKRLRRADRQAILASIELGYSYDQIALVLRSPRPKRRRAGGAAGALRLGEEMARGA
jgi:hypothetical protein